MKYHIILSVSLIACVPALAWGNERPLPRAQEKEKFYALDTVTVKTRASPLQQPARTSAAPVPLVQSEELQARQILAIFTPEDSLTH